MKIKRIDLIAGMCFLAFLSMTSSNFSEAASSVWKPTDNVEIVIPSGPGGGNDRLGRTIQQVLQVERLVDNPITITNKGGGTGAVAWAYLNQHTGNGHYISVCQNALLTNRIRGANPLTYSDVTPLAVLVADHHVTLVNANSPIKTGADLIEMLKKDMRSVSFAQSLGLGSPAHLALALFIKAAGLDPSKLKNVAFKSGPEAMMALLGGHVDVFVTSFGNAKELYRSKKVRALGTTTRERSFFDVPTWREQGIDATFDSWRGVIGPKGMSNEQIAYWDDKLYRLSKSDSWKKYMETDDLDNIYKNSKESWKYLETNYRELEDLLGQLGLK